MFIASCLGALSVILGAFGAHALKKSLSEDALQIFETAVKYQFYHVFALALAALVFQQFPDALVKWAGYCFITGIILFCGSLYLLTYAKAINSASFAWVGPITPFGGLFLITGWVLIAIAVVK